MEQKPFILGINASPFTDVKEHNTARCVWTALQAAEQTGATIKLLNLGQIPHDDGRRPEEMPFEERIDALPDRGGLREAVADILAAQGIIWATPTRNFTASSRMHALFSWLQTHTDYPEYVLAGKVGAFMSVCEEDGGQNANMAMLSPANHMGIIVPPFCTYFYNKNVEEGSTEGDWADTDLDLIGLNVRRMCDILLGKLTPPPGGFSAAAWNDSTIGSW